VAQLVRALVRDSFAAF